MSEKQLSEEQLELLKKPLPKEAVSQHPTKKFLSTIKAIYVIERFNDVFGLGGWFLTDEIVENKEHIVVKVSFTAPEYGIVKEAYGGNQNSDRGDSYKGAVTDAITKIGSFLYVGMDVFKGLVEHDKEDIMTLGLEEKRLPTDAAQYFQDKKQEIQGERHKGDECKSCGLGVYIMSKQGKLFCSNKCWLKKQEVKTAKEEGYLDERYDIMDPRERITEIPY